MTKNQRAALAPEDIRRLRGGRSRDAFAELVGVTPLTVYRWELPVGAPQARRPRGKVAARLVEIAGGAGVERGSQAGEERALDATEQTELLPLLERLASGDLRRVENELLALMSSGRVRTLAGRVTAAQALARTVLLARADTSSAFATIAPLLPELASLPGFVELQLHVTAALLFSWPDGRFFDLGKVNAHVARAEKLLPRFGTPENRFLLGMVRVLTVLATGEPTGMMDALAQAAELEPVLASPVASTLLREMEGYVAVFFGRRAAAIRAYEEVAERGAVAASRVRTLAQLALLSIQDARAPREALALIARAREQALQARLQPGLHSMMLDNLEGIALSRLARFADAARVLQSAVDLAAELRWTSLYSSLALAHTHVFTGDTVALRALGERLAAYEGVMATSLSHAIGAWLIATSEALEAPTDARSTDVFDRRVEALEREAGWPETRGDIVLLTAIMAARVGAPEHAHRALRRAERLLEHFPSIWATAIVRCSKGVLLARQGRLHEARQLVESALGTLTLAEDLGNATYARFVLAQIGRAQAEPGATEQIATQRAELERLGYLPSATSDLDVPRAVETPARATAVEGLVVPLQRLAVRGMSPALIQRELVTVVAEHIAGAAVCLEEIDSTGRSTLLARVGPTFVPTEWVELSDGVGGRLRLGAGGPSVGSESLPVLMAFAGVAELALELAALRNRGGRPAPSGTTAREDDIPEIPGFISVSSAMRALKVDLARLSRSRSTVVITGESGSGKEVVARAIHDLSTRAHAPYIAFNCAAVPRDLFEGQLFGYRKGAFTGAASDQPGVLRAAEGGTVLLDEIGELPLDVQPKLLRFLENGEILPLGERKPLRLDVRVIAATYRDLEELVREGRFREDLFYRLQVVPLHVPPLRERPDDIVALARHFIGVLTPTGQEPPALAPDALAALHAHRWPGNVRELRNVIERSLAFAPLPPVLGAEHLRFAIPTSRR
jgi:tetratricopeptide (TPR) repeat protein